VQSRESFPFAYAFFKPEKMVLKAPKAKVSTWSVKILNDLFVMFKDESFSFFSSQPSVFLSNEPLLKLLQQNLYNFKA
jgi:hypothetical protein